MGSAVLRRCARLAGLDDVELATRFLSDQQVHAHRERAVLSRWAAVATEAGHDAARSESGAEGGFTVVTDRAGLRPGWVVVAEYSERRHEIRLHDDVLELAGALVERLGWAEWYPAGVLREAAVAHEVGHGRLHGAAARALRERLGVRALRLGRYRRYAHISGTPELFAHGYAHQACGLGRSPLLLTAALAVAAGARTGKDAV
ncbi:hypothetical protein FG385_18740 [Amycolatopsis alkalitolerans]|uniref:Uncharacterized protein n=1 Tax=Amycolatopsis alkalitolerans TaxID=2547244 RepID=A0A5C4LXD9_9PSEU|nr:hypothetical protein FG385_18740 [Amycolatopsis alkalitolerans]